MRIEVKEHRPGWREISTSSVSVDQLNGFDLQADGTNTERTVIGCNCFACLYFIRPGPAVHSRSWCLLGSR